MAGSRLFRTWIRNTHLVLGLTSGIVVFVVAITGCLWVFQEEIRELTTETYTFEVQTTDAIPPTRVREIAEGVYPGRTIHGVLYGNMDEPVEVIFYEEDPEFYRSLYLNPHSGEVLGDVDHASGFFHFLLEGHVNLWMPEEIGNQVVSWSTVIFVLMLGTGLVLWWPKTKSGRKKRLKFIWRPGTGWKRKNFDLHSIVGFYVSLLALIASLTGLMMAFEWVQGTLHQAVGGERSVVFDIPDRRSRIAVGSAAHDVAPIDQLLPLLKKTYPDGKTYEIHFPYSDSSSIYVEIAYQDGVYYSSDYRFYDPNTLEELKTASVYGAYDEATAADMLVRTNYDIHVGAILGLPGKILAFLSSLLVATLPVTGGLMWWGRRRGNTRMPRLTRGYKRARSSEPTSKMDAPGSRPATPADPPNPLSPNTKSEEENHLEVLV